MKVNETAKRRSKLMKKFAVLFILFILVALILNSVFTYVNYKKSYTAECETKLKNIVNDISGQMEKDGVNVALMSRYILEHKDEMRIPYDFDGDAAKQFQKYSALWEEVYPDYPLGTKVPVEKWRSDVKKAYMEYQFARWLYVFEQTKNSYGLKYLYYVVPVSDTECCYIIDGIREKQSVNGKDYIKLGTVAEQVGPGYENFWKTWENGMEPDEFDIIDNSFGYVYSYYAPVKVSGEKAGMVCADIDVNYIMGQMRNASIRQTTISLIVFILCTIFVLLWIRRMVIKRIEDLECSVGKYAESKELSVAQDIRTKHSETDELGHLGQQFAGMIEELDVHMKDLQQITAEKERISTELNVAAEIQSSMLPGIFPPFPEKEEFDLFASMDPAKEVGGDFYDFFMVDEDHLAVVIADVSGKGVPAALFMVIAKTLIKNHAQNGESPEQVFINVNNQLQEGNGGDMFVTAWIGIWECSTGRLLFADAGHDSPYIIRNDGNIETLNPKKKRMPLAAWENTQYLLNETELHSGDTLFLYTDGVPEATDANGGMFQMDRLEKCLNENGGKAPAALLQAVRSDVDAFVGEAPQFDDLTMLALKIQSKI